MGAAELFQQQPAPVVERSRGREKLSDVGPVPRQTLNARTGRKHLSDARDTLLRAVRRLLPLESVAREVARELAARNVDVSALRALIVAPDRAPLPALGFAEWRRCNMSLLSTTRVVPRPDCVMIHGGDVERAFDAALDQLGETRLFIVSLPPSDDGYEPAPAQAARFAKRAFGRGYVLSWFHGRCGRRGGYLLLEFSRLETPR